MLTEATDRRQSVQKNLQRNSSSQRLKTGALVTLDNVGWIAATVETHRFGCAAGWASQLGA